MAADPRIQHGIAEAIRLLHAKQPTQALRVLEPLLPRLRKEPNALKLHAVILVEAGQPDKAVATIGKAIRLRPMDADLAAAQAKILSQAGRFDEAIAGFERCLALNPAHTEALDGFVRALRMVHRDRDAVAAVVAAQRAGAPSDPFFAAAIGEAALVRGQDAINPDDAIAVLRTALDSGRVPAAAAAELGFRLGALLDRAGRCDEAFEAFAAANRRVETSFNAEAHRRATDQIIETWTADRLAPADGAQPDHHVFIVGMPRSGTTLVEQILAANPRVATAGETMLLPDAAGELGLARPPFRYATEHAELERPPVEAAASRFSAKLRRAANAGERSVTIDKLPVNAFFVPIAARLFPNARFIGCRRDPRDVGLSCFQQSFSGGNRTLYDLGHIAHFHADTLRVMTHWAETIPERFTLVDYEAVVGDAEAAARELSQAAGVDFNEASLRFWESVGPINTASYAQATRPVYTSSVGRWKRYARHLGPLIDTLADRGIDPG